LMSTYARFEHVCLIEAVTHNDSFLVIMFKFSYLHIYIQNDLLCAKADVNPYELGHGQ